MERSKKKRNIIIISSISAFLIILMIISIAIIRNEKYKRRLIGNIYQINAGDITKIEITNYNTRYEVTDKNAFLNDLMNIEVKPRSGTAKVGVMPGINIHLENGYTYDFSDDAIGWHRFENNYTKLVTNNHYIVNEHKIKELFNYYLNAGSLVQID